MKQKEPAVHVGILLSKEVTFRTDGPYQVKEGKITIDGEARAELSGGNLEIRQKGECLFRGREIILEPVQGASSSFHVRDVIIGIGFHWERKEDQVFTGSLKLVSSDDQVRVINVVSVEDYLVSVISSEMRGDSSPDLLKAHTLISRSWLLAQIQKRDTLAGREEDYESIHETEEEYIRWYDREDHSEFHVCADDHCQRYQGITRASNPEVVRAVEATRGEVISFGGKICDARFSKCCGGVTEKFEYCWEPLEHPYLLRVDDSAGALPGQGSDLKREENARDFILGAPDRFCNTTDARLLSQVLNDYDQESPDFYRWRVEYAQEELADLIARKSGIDFGRIIDLNPVERGESGRLVKLRIMGSKRTMVVGKELEIRRWLSESHLYSSAFVVEREDVREGIPGRFVLKGAGWGHGVGLCQIGAAVMADRNYSYEEIIMHYFRGASIELYYE